MERIFAAERMDKLFTTGIDRGMMISMPTLRYLIQQRHSKTVSWKHSLRMGSLGKIDLIIEDSRHHIGLHDRSSTCWNCA
jgi:hypothetical protein